VEKLEANHVLFLLTIWTTWTSN